MERKITNIKERILYYTDFKGLAKEKFFEELGVTYGNFKGKAKNQALGSDVIERIITKHSDINPTWLLTGKPPMLLSEVKNEVPPTNNSEVEALLREKMEMLEKNNALLEENKALLQEKVAKLETEIQALKSAQGATVNQFNQPSQNKPLTQPLTQSTR
ncbi:hypothetical protein CAPN006_14280 [Capnocytophaga canimorsus]|uniref:hypothetical protein n=1 Tax=Capnocytophaga canimorsus TaxID=28188 RepID=UPI001AD034E0|nr:hypothetical protein [Capnocytophaga canimorsus]GIM57035.1 hypothetical protein CAPN006_14280 [Capnocytophaga canimorsus]